LWAVVKANAYGHGIGRVARALQGAVDGFGLVETEAARALRAAGLETPILMMEGFYSAADLQEFSRLALIPVLHDLEQVRQFAATPLARPLPLYLKLNTGMNRLGLNADELPQALAELRGLPHAGPLTLMTHFADADEPRGISEQMACFAAMRGDLALPVCLANSAALLRFPEARGDWARPGIMLYGGSPFPTLHSAADLGLQPVMSLEAELIAVRQLQAGDRVGYAGNFVAAAPMRIGVVACGYGDGYPRHAPSGTPVVVAGQRTRTLGRVSMDKICVDLTGIAQAQVGSPVLLWGQRDGVRLDADEVASAAGTVSYELFCALAARVPVVE
jgi:alanine racemase